MGIPVAHVEAGLRSFDRTMPEEINRLLTDAIAEYLFVSEPSGVVNLKREGVDDKNIFLVGNIMIDSLVTYREKAKQSDIRKTLGLLPRSFALMTLHRPSNVDTKEGLEKILILLEGLAGRTTIVFPIHPRTKKMIGQFGLEKRTEAIKGLKLIEPLGYVDFLCLMEQAQLVVTDSGGIQEETTYLGIPCLTMRENTERPITVEVGTNQLTGSDINVVLSKSLEVLDGKGKRGTVPELWDGKTAERISNILQQQLLN
jgi:UDP-N-acetylglucosamine 2-epimerase (non-hydrolysing)